MKLVYVWMFMFLAISAIITLRLGLVENSTISADSNEVRYKKMGLVTKFEDDEYQVVCWQYNDNVYAGGISCIPENQLVRKN